MTALLAPRPTPDQYLHTVAAQDALRAAVSDLTDERIALEIVWVDTFLDFLDAPLGCDEWRRLNTRLDELATEVAAKERAILHAKEQLR